MMRKYLGKRPKRIKEWARLGYNGKSDDPDYDHYKPRRDHKINMIMDIIIIYLIYRGL